MNSVCIVAEALGDDLDKFVFVGGVAAALLIEHPAAGDVRPTDDVDLVADISTYVQYAKLTDLLRKKHGFLHDINGRSFWISWKGHCHLVMKLDYIH